MSLVAIRRLIYVLYAPWLVFLGLNLGLLLFIQFGFEMGFLSPPGTVTPLMVIFGMAVLPIVQVFYSIRIFEDYYTVSRLRHFMFYRIGNTGIFATGLLQLIPLCILSGFQGTVIGRCLLQLTYSVFAGAVCAALLLALLSVYLLVLLYGKSQAGRRRINDRKGTLSSGRFSRLMSGGKNGALLVRDIKTIKRGTLFVELPVMFCFSIGLYVLGYHIGNELHNWLLQVCSFYFSYTLFLQFVLTVSTDNEYKRVQSFHLRFYRLFPDQMKAVLNQRTLLSSGVLLICHCLISTCWFGFSPVSLRSDLLGLVLAIAVMQLLVWFYLWLLKRGYEINTVLELFSGFLTVAFPLALVFGVFGYWQVKKKGRSLA
jgi:hypothetical protein